jgi:hypothetical protein
VLCKKLRQQRFGHSDPRLTLNSYSHVESEDARRIARQLGDIVWGEFRIPNGPLNKEAGSELESSTLPIEQHKIGCGGQI